MTDDFADWEKNEAGLILHHLLGYAVAPLALVAAVRLDLAGQMAEPMTASQHLQLQMSPGRNRTVAMSLLRAADLIEGLPMGSRQ